MAELAATAAALVSASVSEGSPGRDTAPSTPKRGATSSRRASSPASASVSPSVHAVDRLEAKILSIEQERQELRLLNASMGETLQHKHARAEDLAGEGVCRAILPNYLPLTQTKPTS